MVRSRLAWFALSFVFFAGGTLTYLMNTTRYTIDRSASVIPPTSPKSQPEPYTIGYQPPLTYSEDRAPCATHDPLKMAFFGDLHIHTALSGDAFADGTRVFPDEAYRFAQGEAITLPAPNGDIGPRAQLNRPLDFAAITDHAEALGESYICRTEGAFPGYNTRQCEIFRRGKDAGVRVFGVARAGTRPRRRTPVCGADGSDCREAARIVWQSIIEAAETAYDRGPDCAFTSFVGYEYTRSPSGMHMHRNTIFKNADVPVNPGNYVDQPTLYQLLDKLERECRQDIEACDVISIPHNSNLSSGNAFNPDELAGFSNAARQAHREQRRAFDRLMEISQHKGTSECVNGVTDILSDADEYCDIEAVRQIGQRVRAFDVTSYIPRIFTQTLTECGPEYLDPKDNLYKGPCVSSRDFARGAWLEGLQEHTHHGVNPFQFGVIGSTDTHVGAAGLTREADYPGHIGHETRLEDRLGTPALGRHNRIESNPGGLAGIWAVENSRDALFQSMKRREAFATSGTRIAPRFFAGSYESDICDTPDWLATAYARGVPMGARLSDVQPPLRFLAHATRDPHETANPLKQLQIIKGWLDTDGRKHTKIFDVAGNPRATRPEEGADTLCATWSDPDYDPAEPTYYYLRVLETPSPRWNAAQCNALSEADRPAGCSNDAPDMTHEVAWTSPIWIGETP